MLAINYPIQYGDINMGNVSDEKNRTARFPIDLNNVSLLFIRVSFTGGSGTANLVMYLDKRANSLIPKTRFKLFTWLSVGASKQVHTRVTKEERDTWQFSENDELVFEWTNPDPSITKWAIEIGLTNAINEPR